jgi:Trk K+ transport system NAD-binding subunit
MERKINWRLLRASWRDTWILFDQFRWPLTMFSAAVLGGGLIYYILAMRNGEPPDNPVEAIYHILGLTFLQPIEAFPKAPMLILFYFLMPVIGIGILAHGFADFGVLLFNRRARDKEWEIAVASTFDDHIVLVGLGHLGYRIAHSLVKLAQDVVVIELDPNADLLNNVQRLGVPVIRDDARRESTLEAAGIRRARALVLCVQNDSANLQIALKARSLQPSIQVVLRIFDDDFAQALQHQFGFTAFSATGMAAPAFAAAASGVDMTLPLTVEGETLSLAKMILVHDTKLSGMTVGQLEAAFEASVVLLHSDGKSDFHPAANRRLAPGDSLAILGNPATLNSLAQANKPTKHRLQKSQS